MQRYIFKILEFDNYDGDTFTLRLDMGFGMQWIGSVRIHLVDTPELRGGTDRSKAAGKLAKAEAAKFVQQGMAGRGAYFQSEYLEEKSTKMGKYGRPLGDILCYKGSEDTIVSLTFHLIKRRLAVDYYGGSKALIAAQHEANITYLEKAGLLKEYL